MILQSTNLNLDFNNVCTGLDRRISRSVPMIGQDSNIACSQRILDPHEHPLPSDHPRKRVGSDAAKAYPS